MKKRIWTKRFFPILLMATLLFSIFPTSAAQQEPQNEVVARIVSEDISNPILILQHYFQAFRAVLVPQLEQRHAGPVALLLDLVAGENTFHDGGGVRPCFRRPLAETLAVPLRVFLVIRRHMGLLRAVLPAPSVQAYMGANPIPLEEHLDDIAGQAHVHLAFYELEGHGVKLLVHADVVVERDSSDFPNRQLVGFARQGQKHGPFFREPGCPAAVFLLERVFNLRASYVHSRALYSGSESILRMKT